MLKDRLLQQFRKTVYYNSLGSLMVALAKNKARAQFRYESDLVSVVRDALPRLAFRHDKNSAVEVFSEVPAVHGVPDLAGIRFNHTIMNLRADNEVMPLSTDSEVRVVMAMATNSTIQDIADCAGLSVGYVRQVLIPLLTDLGWIESDGVGNFVRRAEAQWVGRRVVTVEAKLRDWRKALAQARRQRLSADASYIALEARVANSMSSHLSKIADEGIGMIAVNAEMNRAQVISRPNRVDNSRRELGRNLLAERCLNMFNQGKHEGQIYPVFGWTLPPNI